MPPAPVIAKSAVCHSGRLVANNADAVACFHAQFDQRHGKTGDTAKKFRGRDRLPDIGTAGQLGAGIRKLNRWRSEIVKGGCRSHRVFSLYSNVLVAAIGRKPWSSTAGIIVVRYADASKRRASLGAAAVQMKSRCAKMAAEPFMSASTTISGTVAERFPFARAISRAARNANFLQRLAAGSRLRMLMNNLDPEVAENVRKIWSCMAAPEKRRGIGNAFTPSCAR